MRALRRQERHSGAMPSIQVKDVPPETHAVLRRRAAAAHQSLQEYLRARLIAEAASPTIEENPGPGRGTGRRFAALPDGGGGAAGRP
jgi:hypothetical protein